MLMQTKSVSILLIKKADSLVLFEQIHDGEPILFIPGESSDKFSPLKAKFIPILLEHRIVPFGKIVNTIIKPDETVTALIDVYKFELADSEDFQLPDGSAWYSRDQIARDPRVRRDKQLYLRLLDPQPLNLEYTEEQLHRWVDAKIVSWREL
jgi:hypothetical protein